MASDLSNSYSTPITNRDGQQRVNSGASASFHSAAATQSGPTSNKSNIHIPMTTTPSSTSSSHHSTYVDSVTSNPNSSFNQYSNSHSHSRSGDGNPILKRSNLLSQPTINDSPSVNANINKQNRRVNNERSIHRFGNKAKVRSASGNSSGSGSGSSDREKEESNIQLKEAKENLNRNDEAENDLPSHSTASNTSPNHTNNQTSIDRQRQITPPSRLPQMLDTNTSTPASALRGILRLPAIPTPKTTNSVKFGNRLYEDGNESVLSQSLSLSLNRGNEEKTNGNDGSSTSSLETIKDERKNLEPSQEDRVGVKDEDEDDNSISKENSSNGEGDGDGDLSNSVKSGIGRMSSHSLGESPDRDQVSALEELSKTFSSNGSSGGNASREKIQKGRNSDSNSNSWQSSPTVKISANSLNLPEEEDLDSNGIEKENLASTSLSKLSLRLGSGNQDQSQDEGIVPRPTTLGSSISRSSTLSQLSNGTGEGEDTTNLLDTSLPKDRLSDPSFSKDFIPQTSNGNGKFSNNFLPLGKQSPARTLLGAREEKGSREVEGKVENLENESGNDSFSVPSIIFEEANLKLGAFFGRAKEEKQACIDSQIEAKRDSERIPDGPSTSDSLQNSISSIPPSPHLSAVRANSISVISPASLPPQRQRFNSEDRSVSSTSLSNPDSPFSQSLKRNQNGKGKETEISQQGTSTSKSPPSQNQQNSDRSSSPGPSQPSSEATVVAIKKGRRSSGGMSEASQQTFMTAVSEREMDEELGGDQSRELNESRNSIFYSSPSHSTSKAPLASTPSKGVSHSLLASPVISECNDQDLPTSQAHSSFQNNMGLSNHGKGSGSFSIWNDEANAESSVVRKNRQSNASSNQSFRSAVQDEKVKEEEEETQDENEKPLKFLSGSNLNAPLSPNRSITTSRSPLQDVTSDLSPASKPKSKPKPPSPISSRLSPVRTRRRGSSLSQSHTPESLGLENSFKGAKDLSNSFSSNVDSASNSQTENVAAESSSMALQRIQKDGPVDSHQAVQAPSRYLSEALNAHSKNFKNEPWYSQLKEITSTLKEVESIQAERHSHLLTRALCAEQDSNSLRESLMKESQRSQVQANEITTLKSALDEERRLSEEKRLQAVEWGENFLKQLDERKKKDDEREELLKRYEQERKDWEVRTKVAAVGKDFSPSASRSSTGSATDKIYISQDDHQAAVDDARSRAKDSCERDHAIQIYRTGLEHEAQIQRLGSQLEKAREEAQDFAASNEKLAEEKKEISDLYSELQLKFEKACQTRVEEQEKTEREKKDWETLESRVQESESQVKVLKDELSEVTSALQEAREEASRKTQEMEELRHQLETSESQIENLQQEVNDHQQLESLYEENKQHLETALNQESETSDKLQQLEQEYEEIKFSHETLQNESEEKYQELLSKYQSLKVDLDEAQEQQAELKSGEARFEELEGQLRQSEVTNKDLERKIQAKENHISELVASSKSLRSSKEALEKERDSIQSLLTQADDQRKVDLSNIGRLTSAIGEAERELETLRDSKVQLEQLVSALESNMTKLDRSKRSYKDQVEKLTSQVNVEKNKSRDLESEIKNFKPEATLKIDESEEKGSQEMERLKKQIQELQNLSAHHDLDLHRLETSNSKLYEANQQFRIALAAKQQELSLLKRGVLPRRENGENTPTQQSLRMIRAESQEALKTADSTSNMDSVALQKGPSAPPANAAALRAARRKTIDPTDSIPLRRNTTTLSTSRNVIPGQGSSRRPSITAATSTSSSNLVTRTRPMANTRTTEESDSSSMPPPKISRPRSGAISNVNSQTSSSRPSIRERTTSNASQRSSRLSMNASNERVPASSNHSRASSISRSIDEEAEEAVKELTMSQKRTQMEKEREGLKRRQSERDMDLSELTLSISSSRKSSVIGVEKDNKENRKPLGESTSSDVSSKARRISLAPSVPVGRLGQREGSNSEKPKDKETREVGDRVSRKRSALPA